MALLVSSHLLSASGLWPGYYTLHPWHNTHHISNPSFSACTIPRKIHCRVHSLPSLQNPVYDYSYHSRYSLHMKRPVCNPPYGTIRCQGLLYWPSGIFLLVLLRIPSMTFYRGQPCPFQFLPAVPFHEPGLRFVWLCFDTYGHWHRLLYGFHL